MVACGGGGGEGEGAGDTPFLFGDNNCITILFDESDGETERNTGELPLLLLLSEVLRDSWDVSDFSSFGMTTSEYIRGGTRMWTWWGGEDGSVVAWISVYTGPFFLLGSVTAYFCKEWTCVS